MKKKIAIALGAVAAGLLVLAMVVVAAVSRLRERWHEPAPEFPEGSAEANAAPEEGAAEGSSAGYLYGRVTTTDGAVHEGRLRFGGGGEEAFWGDSFNGFKPINRWAEALPADRMPKKRHKVDILGLEILQHDKPLPLGRVFVARFGDVARIETEGREVRVTIKSGTVFELDRFEAGDIDDDLRVWEAGGIVDLGTQEIGSIELLANPAKTPAPARLHGTVRTAHVDFTGFVEWDRDNGLASDVLRGSAAAGGGQNLRFDAIRSLARRKPRGLDVTLADGGTLQLSGHGGAGDFNRGLYVDDPRYGRVLVRWETFVRFDLSTPGEAGSGPTYGDYPPGSPLRGTVTTRDGRSFAGRLVFDLDESETTETLDADANGIDYMLPFGLVTSIALPGGETSGDGRARVTLRSGEALDLEMSGDLGEDNLGMLVFVEGAEKPEYASWRDIARIDLDPVPPIYPPVAGGSSS